MARSIKKGPFVDLHLQRASLRVEREHRIEQVRVAAYRAADLTDRIAVERPQHRDAAIVEPVAIDRCQQRPAIGVEGDR